MHGITHKPGMWARDRARYAAQHPDLLDVHSVVPEGVLVWDEERQVRVETWDANEVDQIGDAEYWDHEQVLTLLSDLLDDLATQLPHAVYTDIEDPTSARYDLVSAAYALVLSDLETGVSLAAWPVMSRLVDRALTWATTMDEKGTFIQADWDKF